jgi:transcriptional regulator with XRE-family HTH domain
MGATTTSEQVLDLARVRRLASSGEARRVRLAAGLSLYDLAGAVGVAAATVHRWERGESRPSGEAALRYGALLGAVARQVREAGIRTVAKAEPCGARDEV